jgi:ribosome-binding protein aMBF1 (putative translation factor)
MIKMSGYKKWSEVKDTMTALSKEERDEIDMVSEIIAQIVKRRHELGISQRELEKMSGIRQEAICRIESLVNTPQLDTLIRLMKPLGLKLSVTTK